MRDRLDSASAFREHSVIVFVNSAAGGGRASVCLPRIQKVFKSLRMQAQFVMTNSASELESCAQAAISHGEQLLFAMGGDGTFQSLVNASFGADVVLGILPIGGGNDFASALGLPSEPLEAAWIWLESAQPMAEHACTQVGEELDSTRRPLGTPVARTAIYPAASATLQRHSTRWLDMCL